jgi:hypothetical protein
MENVCVKWEPVINPAKPGIVWMFDSALERIPASPGSGKIYFSSLGRTNRAALSPTDRSTDYSPW